jgi:predicted  nucleic acid-binding Zn-ribbon protein
MAEENLISIYKDFLDYTMNQHTQIIKANLLFERQLYRLLTTNNTSTTRLRRTRTNLNERNNNRLFSLFIPNTRNNISNSNNSISSDRLSLDFIQQNTTTNLFERLDNTINSTCPITRNEFTNDSIVTQINGCHHCFDTTAINHWFLRGHTTCPSCRFDLLNQSTSNSRTTRASTTTTESETPTEPTTETETTTEVTTETETATETETSTSNDTINSSLERELTSILLNPNITSTVNTTNLENLTRTLFNIATEFDNSTDITPIINTHVTSFS